MIINFGSINTDLVYQVDHMPEAGETLAALTHEKFLGGKGLNQSVAIARAGGELRHVGCIGAGDFWIREQVATAGLDLAHVNEVAEPTGHAIIFVDRNGENEIVICGGANQRLSDDMVSTALDGLDGPDHWVLFQNETNLTELVAKTAKDLGFKIAYSAAPFSAAHALPLLPLVDLVAVNETEAAELAAAADLPFEEIGVPMLLVTKGSKGADLCAEGACVHQPAVPVDPVDTTGAGDTFLGSFLARLDLTGDAVGALHYAAFASALQVTRPGAANAIPTEAEVLAYLEVQRR
ncbi:MAG: ribokinase [Rhodobacteraceae bacterium]|nr:ribokinase [Paracoccaceae bacterium]